MHAVFWLEDLKDSNNLEDLGIDGKIQYYYNGS
jgi:hypothetical protein